MGNELSEILIEILGLLACGKESFEKESGIDWKNIYRECKYYKEDHDMNATIMVCEKKNSELRSCKGCKIYEAMMNEN